MRFVVSPGHQQQLIPGARLWSVQGQGGDAAPVTPVPAPAQTGLASQTYSSNATQTTGIRTDLARIPFNQTKSVAVPQQELECTQQGKLSSKPSPTARLRLLIQPNSSYSLLHHCLGTPRALPAPVWCWKPLGGSQCSQCSPGERSLGLGGDSRATALGRAAPKPPLSSPSSSSRGKRRDEPAAREALPFISGEGLGPGQQLRPQGAALLLLRRRLQLRHHRGVPGQAQQG